MSNMNNMTDDQVILAYNKAVTTGMEDHESDHAQDMFWEFVMQPIMDELDRRGMPHQNGRDFFVADMSSDC